MLTTRIVSRSHTARIIRNRSIDHRVRSKAFSTTTPPPVLSRRLLIQHAMPKQRVTDASSSSNTAKPSELPWPKSMVRAAYAASIIGIPYFLTWCIASNATARTMLATYVPSLPDRLRMYFGHDDDTNVNDTTPDTRDSYFHHVAQYSYPERIGSSETRPSSPTLQLPGEDSWKVRETQAQIDARNTESVAVRIVTHGESHDDTAMVVIPAHVPATLSGLAPYLSNDRATAIQQGGGSMALEFVEQNPDNTTTTADETNEPMSDSNTWSSSDSTTSTPTTAAGPDPLQHAMQIYSLWHFFPTSNQQQQSQSTMNEVELERSRLQYQLETLQRELRDPYNARAVDVIQAEIKETRRALRILKWKEWMPFL
jgi:hypothetical protein